MIKNAKQASWKEFVTEQLQTPWNVVYKLAAAKINSQPIFGSIKKADGSYTLGWEETVTEILHNLLPDDKEEEDNEEQRRIREELTNKVVPTHTPVTAEEVMAAIGANKPKKAPGPDGIPAEILKGIAGQLATPLSELFTECLAQGRFPNTWKQGNITILHKGKGKCETKCNSYRPVCLLDLLGKTFERVLNERLLKCLEQAKALHPNQYGFRKGRSTEDCLMRIKDAVQASNQKYVIALFVDISGAFNNLWYPALFERLEELTTPPDLLQTLKDYCQNRWARVIGPEGKVQKPLNKGAPQGSVLGPQLWNIIMDVFLKELEPVCLLAVAFADDLTFLIEGNSRRELEEKSKTATETLDRLCARTKLSIAGDKTELILLKGMLAGNRPPTVKIGGKTAKMSGHARCLGYMVQTRWLTTVHVQTAASRAKNALFKILSWTKQVYNLPLKTLSIYYEAIFISILTYAPSAWAEGLGKTNAGILLRAQYQVLKALTRAYKTTNAEALQLTTGKLPVDLEVRKRAAKYWLRKGNPEKAEKVLPGIMEGRTPELITAMLWEERMEASQNDAKAFFPTVRERMGVQFWPTPAEIQVLTGHGPFKAKLHGMHRVDSPKCECGADHTATHLLFECQQRGEDTGKLREYMYASQVPVQRLLQTDEGRTLFKKAADEIIDRNQDVFDLPRPVRVNNNNDHSPRRGERRGPTRDPTPPQIREPTMNRRRYLWTSDRGGQD